LTSQGRKILDCRLVVVVSYFIYLLKEVNHTIFIFLNIMFLVFNLTRT